MAAPKIPGEFTLLLQRGQNAVIELNRRTHGWLGVLGSAFRETVKPYSVISAAAISYFTLFSIFPLILLSISIASFNVSPLLGWKQIAKILEFIAPALDQLLGENIGNIIQTRGSLTGIALVGLIWSGSSIFYTLTLTLNEIWGHKRPRSVWRRRGLAILFVLVIIGPVLFLVSIGGSLIDNVSAWVPDQLVLFGKGFSFLAAILFDVILLMVLYILFPHGASSWREILPGAIGAGLLWELAKKGFLSFVSTYLTASNLIYGSVTTLTAFLTWAYLSGLIFLFGAYVSLAYYQLKQQRQAVLDQQKIPPEDEKDEDLTDYLNK